MIEDVIKFTFIPSPVFQDIDPPGSLWLAVSRAVKVIFLLRIGMYWIVTNQNNINHNLKYSKIF